jgi:PAS domain-containing protein
MPDQVVFLILSGLLGLAVIGIIALVLYYQRAVNKLQMIIDRVGKDNEQARKKDHNRIEEARSIISALEEGLLVLSRNGVILQSNPALRRFAGQQDIKGKRYWELIRNQSFAENYRIKSAGQQRARPFSTHFFD